MMKLATGADADAEADRMLDRLEAHVRKQEGGGGELGVSHTSTAEERMAGAPLDLEAREPQIFDLRQQLIDSGVPENQILKNVMGPARRPLLVCHGVTPLSQPGEKPSRVCALGYEARLAGVRGHTVAYTPDSRFMDVARLDADLELGIDANAALEVPAFTSPARNEVALGPVKIGARTHDRFALSLSLTWTVIEVTAGALADGGVRWNLFQRRDRLERQQALVQVLLVPEDTRELVFTVHTWVKVARLFGKDRFWQSDEYRFRCPLRGG